jgi:restriction endonuclease S subunit
VLTQPKQELKTKYINLMINNSNLIKLKDICTIDTKPNNNTLFCINRNSKSAGFIYKYDIKDANNANVYFINDIKDFNSEYLYIILKQNESKLNKLACITNTINLSKACLENLEIKNVSIDIQNKIIEQYNLYDTLSNEIINKSNRLVNENLFKCICSF